MSLENAGWKIYRNRRNEIGLGYSSKIWRSLRYFEKAIKISSMRKWRVDETRVKLVTISFRTLDIHCKL
jgi:hypothetical protein